MGYNTTVVIMNDALHQIEKDPEFGAKLADAISKLQLNRYKNGVDIHVGGHVNAATAIESHHANNTTVVAVGGNCASLLTTVCGAHHTDEARVDILKKLAYELGYTIHKTPVCKYHGKDKK